MRAILALAMGLLALPAAAEPPRRVVTMNLCADQLALLIGAPGQVVSVSAWAQRPSASNTAEAAAALPANAGLAEQVFVMAPDLVLAGTFTNRAAVDMLTRLGVPVVTLPAASDLAGVAALMRRVGDLLDRRATAEALIADMTAALDAARADAAGLPRESGAWRYANDYTSGAGTLGDAVMDIARLDNAAAALGLSGAARLDLETLVMARPFLLRGLSISGATEGRAFEGVVHPALRALPGGAWIPERWLVCGAPAVARAAQAVVAARTRAPLTAD